MASKSRFQAKTRAAVPKRSSLGVLAAMAYLLAGCVSGDVPKVPADDEGLVRGQAVYGANCANCHGNAGDGGAGNRLNQGLVLDRYPDSAGQRVVVVEGRNKMPAFGATLSDEQIDDVIRYTREIIADQ